MRRRNFSAMSDGRTGSLKPRWMISKEAFIIRKGKVCLELNDFEIGFWEKFSFMGALAFRDSFGGVVSNTIFLPWNPLASI